MSTERERVIAELAKKMGDAGYCNYDACRGYLEVAYEAALLSAQKEIERLREVLQGIGNAHVYSSYDTGLVITANHKDDALDALAQDKKV